jgi:hypothetical protein
MPPGYQYVERARPHHNVDLTTNHGGVALFFQTFLSAKVIQLPEFITFESIGVFVQGSGVHMLVVVIEFIDRAPRRRVIVFSTNLPTSLNALQSTQQSC